MDINESLAREVTKELWLGNEILFQRFSDLERTVNDLPEEHPFRERLGEKFKGNPGTYFSENLAKQQEYLEEIARKQEGLYELLKKVSEPEA